MSIVIKNHIKNKFVTNSNMFICHTLMLFVILRLFGKCLHDTLNTSPEKDSFNEWAKSCAKLPRLQQAMKLYHIKNKHFADNKRFMLSPELYKFCSKKEREPNKIRFGPYNKPKAHQSWVIIRKLNGEGIVYNLPMTADQFETVVEATY